MCRFRLSSSQFIFYSNFESSSTFIQDTWSQWVPIFIQTLVISGFRKITFVTILPKLFYGYSGLLQVLVSVGSNFFHSNNCIYVSLKNVNWLSAEGLCGRILTMSSKSFYKSDCISWTPGPKRKKNFDENKHIFSRI